MDMDEEIHALIIFNAMHDCGKSHILRLDPDSDFFLRFPSRCGADGFSAIQMTSRDAVLTIGIPCVETAQHQDLIFAEEQ